MRLTLLSEHSFGRSLCCLGRRVAVGWGGGAQYPIGLRMHRYDSPLQSCQPASAAPCPDPSAQIFFQPKEAKRALASLLTVAVLRCHRGANSPGSRRPF